MNLLHCLLRELGTPAEREVLTWEGRTEGEDERKAEPALRLTLQQPQLLGAELWVPLLSRWPEPQPQWPCWPDGRQPEPAALQALLLDEITARTGHDSPNVRADHALSTAFTAQFLAPHLAAAQPEPLPRGMNSFIRSEQDLLLGHRFHPSPKSRGELGLAGWRPYSPELQAAFPLEYLLVPHSRLLEGGAPGSRTELADRLTEVAEYAPPAGTALLPVHPVQLQLLRQRDDFQAALRRGEMELLGARGRTFFPGTSLRTLYEPRSDTALKFGLNLRITNWVRRNITAEMQASVALSEYLDAAFPAELRAQMLLEPAYRGAAAPGEDGTPSELQESLGVLQREGTGRHLPAGGWLVPACTLFEEEVAGRPSWLRRIIQAAGVPLEEGLQRLYRSYLSSLLNLSLRCFEEFGVLLEPHLQNTVVAITPQLECRCLVRDMDSVRFIRGRVQPVPAGRAIPAATLDYASYSEEVAWQRLSYTLIVNNLFEVSKAALRLAPALEAPLAEIYREVLQQLARGGSLLADYLLDDPVIWFKANLSTRWRGLRDSQAPFLRFPASTFSGHPL